MEVHVPDHAIHTWRDFLIHMATICLGLLIAIGLEQTVEWAHHRHQLHQLRDALDRDAEKAVRDADSVVHSQLAGADFLARRSLQMRDASLHHTVLVPLQPPAAARARFDLPNDAAWKSARAAGIVSLLPQSEIQAFDEVDELVQMSNESFAAMETSIEDQRALDLQFSDPVTNASNYASATPEQLAEFATLSMKVAQCQREMAAMSLQIKGAEQAVLKGQRDLDQIEKAEAAALSHR
jgi:hypothetical protein